MGAFGSSITAPTNSYAYLVRDWLAQSRTALITSQAISGHWPWSNLVRYPAGLHGAQPVSVVLTDYRIVSEDRDHKAIEALTRLIWTDSPRAVIISPIIPSDANLDGAVNALSQNEIDSISLANYYGVHLVDYRQEIIDRVAAGESLSTYLADEIHPSDAGHALIASMIEAAITEGGWLSGEDHSTLPARQYDTDGFFETTTPTRTVGSGNDGTTGTWTTTGTRIASSEVGATVTFTATCRTFGIYRSDTDYAEPWMDVQIDGGDWLENKLVTHNGQYFAQLADGAHTITLRVRADQTLRIDEFWAI